MIKKSQILEFDLDISDKSLNFPSPDVCNSLDRDFGGNQIAHALSRIPCEYSVIQVLINLCSVSSEFGFGLGKTNFSIIS